MVDEVLSRTMSTTVEITMSLFLDTSSGRVESEWEEEIVDLLELTSKVIDLVDDVLDAFDTVFTESLLNDLVLNKRDSLSVEFSETSLIDEGLDGALRRESVSDIWLNLSEHIHGSLVVLEEDGSSDLGESEKR